MKGFLKLLLSRVGMVSLGILLQFFVLFGSLIWFREYEPVISTVGMVFSWLLTIYVLSLPGNPAYKTAWIILILGFPVLGLTLYLLFGAFSLPFKERAMRQDQYMHSFIRMSRSSVAVAVCAVMALILSFIYRATKGNWQFFTEDILFLILLCAVAALALGIIFLLRSIDFAELPNDAVPYEHSIF